MTKSLLSSLRSIVGAESQRTYTEINAIVISPMLSVWCHKSIRLSVYIKYLEQSQSVNVLKSNIQVRNNKQQKSANSGETASGTRTEEHMAPDHVRGQYIQPGTSAATNHRAAFLKPPRVASGISHSDDVSLPVARCTRVSVKMSLIRFPRETAAAVSHNAPHGAEHRRENGLGPVSTSAVLTATPVKHRWP